MGIYKRVEVLTRNGRPVWKMRGGGQEYLFYNSNQTQVPRIFRETFMQIMEDGCLGRMFLRTEEASKLC